MTKLPSSIKIIRILNNHGFLYKSQKGSHQKFINGTKIVIVPANKKQIPLGTLKSISRQSEIDIDKFLNL